MQGSLNGPRIAFFLFFLWVLVLLCCRRMISCLRCPHSYMPSTICCGTFPHLSFPILFCTTYWFLVEDMVLPIVGYQCCP